MFLTLAFSNEVSTQAPANKQINVAENIRENKNTSAEDNMKLSWNELSNSVCKKVRITMPDSETIEGKVVNVESESFMVNIEKEA